MYKYNKITEESQKLSTNTILHYLNAPLMEIFGGTKEIIEKFIISRYHKGKLYFNICIEVSNEVIYKLTRLSNKGEPVLVGSNPGLVEKLTGTPIKNNSRGQEISQI